MPICQTGNSCTNNLARPLKRELVAIYTIRCPQITVTVTQSVKRTFSNARTPGLRRTTEPTPRGRAVCAPQDTRLTRTTSEAKSQDVRSRTQPRTRKRLSSGPFTTALATSTLCGNHGTNRIRSNVVHTHSLDNAPTIRSTHVLRTHRPMSDSIRRR